MFGMGLAVLTTLASQPAGRHPLLGPGRRRHRHRRRHRGLARAHRQDDGHAAARRAVPRARRPRRRVRGGRRGLRAAGLRHRRTRQHPRRQHDRDVDRSRHRRDHVLRLGHRLPEARRPDVGQADHPAAASSDQRGARRRDRRARRVVRLLAEPCGVPADRGLRVRARLPDHHPDRRRRHAGRRVDAELLFGLGRGRHRLHAGQPRADHHRRAGRLVGRDPVLHHVQGR